ncbi:MAG: aminoglycoside phosphotransferase family protein [Sporichthyaceae bacterium]|nr:aminoglycoside phosphotransferase family protein [Sporichthyaceae bacterium]
MQDRPPFFYVPQQREHTCLQLAPEALDWVRAQLGGSPIIRTEFLTGGISHSNCALTIGGPTSHEVVLRRWTRPGWEIDDADYTVQREALAMDALERAGIPAPRCLAVDPTGAHCGAPALLMTRLAGAQPTAETGRTPSFAEQLAASARAMHERVAVPPGLPEYERWFDQDDQQDLRPPEHAARPWIWERMFEVVTKSASGANQAAFIHRDYHAGNTLWSGSRMTGIVDWTTASAGPVGVDLGHMRVNLVVTGWRELADKYLRAYAALAGPSFVHEPYWDLTSATDFGPYEEFSPTEIERMEDYAGELLSRTGG